MNFNSVFEELNKLYEEKPVLEGAFDKVKGIFKKGSVDNGTTKWAVVDNKTGKTVLNNVSEEEAQEYVKKQPANNKYDVMPIKEAFDSAEDAALKEATIYTTKAKMAQLDKEVEEARKEVAKYNIPMKAQKNSAGETVSVPDFEVVPEAQREAAKKAHDRYQKALAARPDRAKNIIKYTDEMDESLTEAAEDEEIEFAEEPVAPIEEPAEEVEPRQLILECSKCGAIVIKDEADVVVDEESDLVNVEDECEYCEEKEGYKIIGVVAPYEVAEEVANEEPVDEEPVEESLAENYEDDLGRKAWSKNAMSYFDQAAKELGLENFTMKAVSRDINKAGSKDTAIITATKDGKKLEAEDTVEDTNPRNVAEAKEILEFVFGI